MVLADDVYLWTVIRGRGHRFAAPIVPLCAAQDVPSVRATMGKGIFA